MKRPSGLQQSRRAESRHDRGGTGWAFTSSLVRLTEAVEALERAGKRTDEPARMVELGMTNYALKRYDKVQEAILAERFDPKIPSIHARHAESDLPGRHLCRSSCDRQQRPMPIAAFLLLLGSGSALR